MRILSVFRIINHQIHIIIFIIVYYYRISQNWICIHWKSIEYAALINMRPEDQQNSQNSSDKARENAKQQFLRYTIPTAANRVEQNGESYLKAL